ncbi:hypothetical protein EYF80_050977 [Liparis tanakae]|uniref:Uncharacterized protein n=1 Tax=Liparis tanakae TaxID=230148 RepID=A0A4Z2FCF7_9TELE|nr:hypothetical protein EYF80_050977 [Liparis tanakae]
MQILDVFSPYITGLKSGWQVRKYNDKTIFNILCTLVMSNLLCDISKQTPKEKLSREARETNSQDPHVRVEDDRHRTDDCEERYEESIDVVHSGVRAGQLHYGVVQTVNSVDDVPTQLQRSNQRDQHNNVIDEQWAAVKTGSNWGFSALLKDMNYGSVIVLDCELYSWRDEKHD